MRKRKTVFFDSLVALGICWGVTRYFNKSDQESVAMLASSLLMICLFILIPVALRYIKTGRSVRGGVYFFLMLLPLIAAISHPSFYFPVAAVMSVAGTTAPSFYSRWGANLLINSTIFLFTGLVFSRKHCEQQPSWKRTAFTAFIMAAFYVLSFYASGQILAKGWPI